MSMEWLLRFVTWKSSVKGVLARRSEPLTATRKVRGKRLRASFLPLTSWRPDAVLWGFLWPFTSLLIHQGWFPFHPWNHFLGAYLAMSSRYALKAKLLRGELRSALTARAAVASCACERWLRDERIGALCNCVVWRCIVGIVGIDLIRFEDRLTDVYEGYESICLLTAESKYVPSSSCDCAADSVQWSFEVILSDIRSLNESYRLSNWSGVWSSRESRMRRAGSFLICERQRACRKE